MTKPGHKFSSGLTGNFISRKSNRIIGKIVKFLFWTVKFDSESLLIIGKYSKKEAIVYASFESSQTSLLLFMNLLKKNRIPLPSAAFGFSRYLIQFLLDWAVKPFKFLRRLIIKKRAHEISDYDTMKHALEKGHLILPILSKRLFFQRYVKIEADTLQHLIEIQKNSDKPVYIIPKMMFWNMNPERTRTILASSATGDRGIITGFLIKLKSRTPSFIHLSAPISLKDEIAGASSKDTKFLARLIRNKILETYSSEKRCVLGPVIKSNDEMMEKVLSHKNIYSAIDELTRDEKIPEKKLRKNAYKYYREIAADFSILYVKYFEKIISIVFKRIFDGIHYDPDQLRKIREAAGRGPLIVVPSHKSHMDYLIVSSIFFINKINPPHILAGSNLMFFPMGKIFRRSGAFFMRRSFKGMKLYTAVFKQYVRTLVNEGYSIEFFIEGGRTRSGKIMFPKLGMLKYLIESVEEGYNKDLIFAPITINYNRILEESSYHHEHKGGKKTAETASSLVKSGGLLRREYGSVHVEFNEPVSYLEIKKKLKPGVDITPAVGRYIAGKISDIVLVTPVSLITSAILFSPEKGFSEIILKENMMLLHDYLTYMGVKQSEILTHERDYDDMLNYVLNSFSRDHIIKKLGPEKLASLQGHDPGNYFIINDESRERINFYKNSIIHFFLPLSFVAIAIVNFQIKNRVSMKKIRAEYKFLTELFSREFIYPESMDDPEKTIRAHLKYLKKLSLISATGETVTVKNGKAPILRFFAEIMQDFFESYYVAINTVIEGGRGSYGKKDIINEMKKMGAAFHATGIIKLVESISVSNFSNAINYMESAGMITRAEGKTDLIEITATDKADKIRKKIIDYMNRVS